MFTYQNLSGDCYIVSRVFMSSKTTAQIIEQKVLEESENDVGGSNKPLTEKCVPLYNQKDDSIRKITKEAV